MHCLSAPPELPLITCAQVLRSRVDWQALFDLPHEGLVSRTMGKGPQAFTQVGRQALICLDRMRLVIVANMLTCAAGSAYA